jgi:glycerophosphoryl diester phosphodiesterase
MKKILLVIGLSLAGFSCSPILKNTKKNNSFDFEAHRGGRGDMPENTIASMMYAVSIKNIKTLEMDLSISKDKQVVLSHDPLFNHLISTKPNGQEVKPNEQIYLFQLNYDSIIKYDVGIKPHKDFPSQKKIPAVKPLFADVIDMVEKQSKRKMWYNVEIKSNVKNEGVATPAPEEFVALVTNIILKKGIKDRVIIQSFDERPLRILHQQDSTWQLSYLVDKGSSDVDKNVENLGFVPAIYSPGYANVSKNMVDACHAKKMKIIPWTPNTVAAIQSLYSMGVDGIISDYPLLFQSIRKLK